MPVAVVNFSTVSPRPLDTVTVVFVDNKFLHKGVPPSGDPHYERGPNAFDFCVERKHSIRQFLEQPSHLLLLFLSNTFRCALEAGDLLFGPRLFLAATLRTRILHNSKYNALCF